MLRGHIPLIMEIMDNIVLPDDRRRKYTDRQILKILVLLQIFGISYRSSGVFLRNHEDYLALMGVKEIPSFQTLSRRARMIDLHAINGEITFPYSMESIAAVDSFMIHTCKYSTAARRKVWGNYRDPESGWLKTDSSQHELEHYGNTIIEEKRYKKSMRKPILQAVEMFR